MLHMVFSLWFFWGFLSRADIPTAYQECLLSRMSKCSPNPQGEMFNGPCPPGTQTLKPYEPDKDCSEEAIKVRSNLIQETQKKPTETQAHDRLEAIRKRTGSLSKSKNTPSTSPPLATKLDSSEANFKPITPKTESWFSVKPSISTYDYVKVFPTQNGELFIGIEYMNKAFNIWDSKTGKLTKVVQLNSCGDVITAVNEDAIYCFYRDASSGRKTTRSQRFDFLSGAIKAIEKLPNLDFQPTLVYDESLLFYFDKNSSQISGWDSRSGRFIFQKKLDENPNPTLPVQLFWSETKEVLLVRYGIWETARNFYINAKTGQSMLLTSQGISDWGLTANPLILTQNNKNLFRVNSKFILEPILPESTQVLNFSRLQNLEEDFISETSSLLKVHFDKTTGFKAKEIFAGPEKFTYEIRKLSPNSKWLVRYWFLEDKLKIVNLDTNETKDLKFSKIGSKKGNADMPAIVFSANSKSVFLSYKRRVYSWKLDPKVSETIEFDVPKL